MAVEESFFSQTVLTAEDHAPIEAADTSGVEAYWAYISQNQDVMVDSDRAPGLKAPLGMLVNMCPIEVTAKNVDQHYAEASGMVARAHLENQEESEVEENEQAEEPDEKGQAEEKKAKHTEKPPEAKQSKSEAEQSKPRLAAPPEASNTITKSPANASEKPAAARITTSEQTIQQAGPEMPVQTTEAPPHAEMNPAQIASDTPKTAETVNRQPHNRPVKVVESRPEWSPDRQAIIEQTSVVAMRAASRSNETTVTQKPAPEARPVPVAAAAEESDNGGKFGETTNEPRQFMAESAAAQLFIEPVTAIEVTSTTGEDETDLSVELGDEPVAADTPELSEIAAAEDSDSDEDEQVISEPEDTTDAESQFHLTNDGPFQELAEADGERSPLAALSSEVIDAVAELPLPAEEIESTIVELAEVIQELEPDEVEVINEILDDIALNIEAAKERTVEDSSGALTVSETQSEPGEATAEPNSREELSAEVQKLFVELFNYLENEYSPELVNAFTQLAIKQDLAELIKPSEAEGPVIIGDDTHEVINQLLTAVASLKTELGRAHQIGKSVILIYAKQFAIS